MVRDRVRRYWRRRSNNEPWLILPPIWIALCVFVLRIYADGILRASAPRRVWDVFSMAPYAGSWQCGEVRAAAWSLAGILLLVHAAGSLLLLRRVRQDPARWRPLVLGVTLLGAGIALIGTARIFPVSSRKEFAEQAIGVHRDWGAIDSLHFAVQEKMPGAKEHCHACLTDSEPSTRLGGAVVLYFAVGPDDETRRVLVESVDAILDRRWLDGLEDLNDPAVDRAGESAWAVWQLDQGMWPGDFFAGRWLWSPRGLHRFLDEKIRPWWRERRAHYAGTDER